MLPKCESDAVASAGDQPQPGTDTRIAAFDFVRELANDLSSGTLELPSYPEVALRVQRVLGDDRATVERVVRVIGSEPILASRILNMANSVAMNPGGQPAAELRTAVARLGFDALRSAAVCFAVAQLRKAAEYRSIEKQLTVLWQRSVSVAATSFVLARRVERMNPDTAMLAGLVSGVGKLYILTRATRFPNLFGDDGRYQSIVREWHPNIARALLENWGVADEIIEAVQGHEDAVSESRTRATLADVLCCAVMLVDLREAPDLLEGTLRDNRAAVRLQLASESIRVLMDESAAEVAALRDALGN